ncbi:MAG: cytochrome c oxidase subunit II [Deltaproteobacteria bacterium]|nr:cytochrome c oxidase subunit II [Deltaproteobacteria bacterium]
MSKLLFFLPEQASSVAGPVDLFFFFMVAVSVFFSALIAVLLVFFAIRYHQSGAATAPAAGVVVGPEPEHAHAQGAMLLEIVWTVIPLGLVLVMFAWSTSLYFTLVRPPADAVAMYAVGKQWMWKFQHPEGQREINELHVPLGQAVKLTMSSEDVIHSFFVPAFRVKQDVVPGRYTQVWFRPTRVGRYHLFCAEYCGTQHSGMIGWVEVMKPEDYQAWLSGAAGGAPRQTLAQAGEQLFTERACVTCHPESGEGRGPSLGGLPGAAVTLEGGGTVVADDGYLRESILNPAAKIVAGFQPLMPTFQGQLSEEQLVQLLAYIKSLGVKPAAEAPAPPATKD